MNKTNKEISDLLQNYTDVHREKKKLTAVYKAVDELTNEVFSYKYHSHKNIDQAMSYCRSAARSIKNTNRLDSIARDIFDDEDFIRNEIFSLSYQELIKAKLILTLYARKQSTISELYDSEIYKVITAAFEVKQLEIPVSSGSYKNYFQAFIDKKNRL